MIDLSKMTDDEFIAYRERLCKVSHVAPEFSRLMTDAIRRLATLRAEVDRLRGVLDEHHKKLMAGLRECHELSDEMLTTPRGEEVGG